MININIYALISVFISFLYVNTSLSSTIVSHKAYYDLEFLTNETPSIVDGASGKSSFLIEKQFEIVIHSKHKNKNEKPKTSIKETLK